MPRDIFPHTVFALSGREPKILLCQHLCNDTGAAVSFLRCVQPESTC